MTETSDREQRRKLLVRGLAWCLCVGVWTVALLTTYPVEVGKSVTPPTMHFPAAKLLHISAYAFLTLFITWLPLRRGRWLLLAFLSLHAAATEFGQQFVPGRHGMPFDVMIDHVGLFLGVLLSWKRWLSFPKRRAATLESRARGKRVSSPLTACAALSRSGPAASGDISTI